MAFDWEKALLDAMTCPTDAAWEQVDRLAIDLCRTPLPARTAIEMALKRMGAVPGEIPPAGPLSEMSIEHLLQAAWRALAN